MTSAVREWWRQPDHYYWLTAFLAARGAQQGICRVVAGSLVGFALVLLVSLGSPAGPSGMAGRIGTVVIAVALTAMAIGWWREGWPTQRQSAGFVIAAALCISASCLVQADPFNGMFGGATFAVLAGYIAFFHTPRMMAFNFLLALLTGAVLAVRVAVDGDPALAVSTLIFLTVINVATPSTCHALVHLLGIDVLNADIDPLTGLYNRDAFDRAAAAYISSRNRDDDRFFVLVVVDLDNFALLTQAKGRQAGERARVAAAQTLREVTRQNAVIAHLPDTEFLIADSFPTTDSSPLVERVRSAIRTTPPRTSASIGVVSTPMQALAERPPEQILAELLELARSAVVVARRAGGNQAHHINCPPLRALEDDEPPL
ncbi:GGDEF domain-containing protein [Mycolicibacterium litorale]|uniref:Diguanylate cyclase n=1 Tax=Mycolicibacterium litorale TaxID=758802 RepID=A0AAD1IXT8_9MYCO|nr:GGDEF domain-containing protein [Mycolicibacterium litorale]MCV7418474.1 GGDEF domain-containing protein [Mycolicibacterium litorale]TDY06129.1 diguanylate cyclase [Mycolicibacterium litorale]BBY19728.1 diguanylate cyclase [Mycolicibacterium litorale]